MSRNDGSDGGVNLRAPQDIVFDGNRIGAPGKARTSKSDEQLFGEYAGVIRQLGVAADAAEQAHREFVRCRSSASQAPGDADEQDDFAALLSRLSRLRDGAGAVHRDVAQHAIAEETQRRTPCSSDRVASIEIYRGQMPAGAVNFDRATLIRLLTAETPLADELANLVADRLLSAFQPDLVDQ